MADDLKKLTTASTKAAGKAADAHSDLGAAVRDSAKAHEMLEHSMTSWIDDAQLATDTSRQMASSLEQVAASTDKVNRGLKDSQKEYSGWNRLVDKGTTVVKKYTGTVVALELAQKALTETWKRARITSESYYMSVAKMPKTLGEATAAIAKHTLETSKAMNATRANLILWGHTTEQAEKFSAIMMTKVRPAGNQSAKAMQSLSRNVGQLGLDMVSLEAQIQLVETGVNRLGTDYRVLEKESVYLSKAVSDYNERMADSKKAVTEQDLIMRDRFIPMVVQAYNATNKYSTSFVTLTNVMLKATEQSKKWGYAQQQSLDIAKDTAGIIDKAPEWAQLQFGQRMSKAMRKVGTDKFIEKLDIGEDLKKQIKRTMEITKPGLAQYKALYEQMSSTGEGTAEFFKMMDKLMGPQQMQVLLKDFGVQSQVNANEIADAISKGQYSDVEALLKGAATAGTEAKKTAEAQTLDDFTKSQAEVRAPAQSAGESMWKGFIDKFKSPESLAIIASVLGGGQAIAGIAGFFKKGTIAKDIAAGISKTGTCVPVCGGASVPGGTATTAGAGVTGAATAGQVLDTSPEGKKARTAAAKQRLKSGGISAKATSIRGRARQISRKAGRFRRSRGGKAALIGTALAGAGVIASGFFEGDVADDEIGEGGSFVPENKRLTPEQIQEALAAGVTEEEIAEAVDAGEIEIKEESGVEKAAMATAGVGGTVMGGVMAGSLLKGGGRLAGRTKLGKGVAKLGGRVGGAAAKAAPKTAGALAKLAPKAAGAAGILGKGIASKIPLIGALIEGAYGAYETSQMVGSKQWGGMGAGEKTASMSDVWGKRAASFGTLGMSEFIPDEWWDTARGGLSEGLSAAAGGPTSKGASQQEAIRKKMAGAPTSKRRFAEMQLLEQQMATSKYSPLARLTGGYDQQQSQMASMKKQYTQSLLGQSGMKDFQTQKSFLGQSGMKELFTADMPVEKFREAMQQVIKDPTTLSPQVSGKGMMGKSAAGGDRAGAAKTEGLLDSMGSSGMIPTLEVERVLESGDVKLVLKGLGEAFSHFEEESAGMTPTK